MKKIVAAMTVMMLIPSTVLASSIRPGSGPIRPSQPKTPLCLGETEKFTEKCEIVIDETGVKGPEGHITNVVKWTTEEKDFNVGGAIVGGAAGTAGGAALGLASCMIAGPFCLITAPAIMQTGTGVGAGLGGNSDGRFFTIIGDDKDGKRVIQEVYYRSKKTVKQASKDLLRTTTLAEGELHDS